MKLLMTIFLSISMIFGWGSVEGSTFTIQFIDVGQGDAALIECNNHYMLIDAGDKNGGYAVYDVLQEHGINKLDILAISHLHEDHYGGFEKVLTYVSRINLTICNKDYSTELGSLGTKIKSASRKSVTSPKEGEKYKLDKATIEIVDSTVKEDNDSLVLLITFGDTKFLFTGDIEAEAQKRIASKYDKDSGKSYKIDVLKVPHHGSDKSEKNYNDSSTGSLYRFIRAFDPSNAIISVGANNKYKHPGERTLEMLKQADSKIYRTDKNGTITVKSNGKSVKITTSK